MMSSGKIPAPPKIGVPFVLFVLSLVALPASCCIITPILVLNASNETKSRQNRDGEIARLHARLQDKEATELETFARSLAAQNEANKFRDPKLMKRLETETKMIAFKETKSELDWFHVIGDKPFDPYHLVYECVAITKSKDVVNARFIVKDNSVLRNEDYKITRSKTDN